MIRWFLILFSFSPLFSGEARLLWNYLTDEERRVFESSEDFTNAYYSSVAAGEIRGYIGDSLFVVGRGYGNFNIGGWSEMDLYRDTLYISTNGQDCIRKFTLSGEFVSYFGNRENLYYIWSVAVNDRNLALCSAGGISFGGGQSRNYIVRRTEPSVHLSTLILDSAKLARMDMDSLRIYGIMTYGYNGQYGPLWVYRDSTWDSLYVIKGSFFGLKSEENTLYLIDTFRIERFEVFGNVDSIVKTASTCFSPEKEIRLQDVSASEGRLYVAAFKNPLHPDDPDSGKVHEDSLYLFTLDKDSLTLQDTFFLGIASHDPGYYSLSLEALGDTLLVLLLRPEEGPSRVLERYLVTDTGIVGLGSFGNQMEHPRWWPSYVRLFQGSWIATNTYGVKRLTFRNPDGAPYRSLEIPWQSYGVVRDSALLYVSTGLEVREGIPINGVYKIDTLGTQIDSFTVPEYSSFHIAPFQDTIIALKDTFGNRDSKVFLIDPQEMETVRTFYLPCSRKGGFYVDEDGRLFYPYNPPSDSFSSIRIYDLQGNLVEEVLPESTALRYFSLVVNEEVFPWEIYVGTLNATSPLLVFELDPYTYSGRRVDSLGEFSSIHSYWQWDPDLDDDYLSDPELAFVWNVSKAGNKIFLTDVYNTRLVIYLPRVKLQSDDEFATRYPANRHLLRVPNTESLHLIYESQGNLYYHFSPDGGRSWNPPKVVEEATSPCLYSTEENWADMVFISHGMLKYVGFDPDYVMGQTTTLMTSETEITSPPILVSSSGETKLINVIYEGKANGVPVIAHSVYEVGSLREMEPVLLPSAHYIVDVLSEQGSHPSLALDPILGHLHLLYEKEGEIFYSEFNGEGWSDPLNISNSPNEVSVFPFIESYGDRLYAAWAEGALRAVTDVKKDLGPGLFSIVKKERHLGDPWPQEGTPLSIPGGDSRYPVVAEGEFTLWSQRSLPDENNWDIFYQRKDGAPQNLTETPGINSTFAHAARKQTLRSTYLYTAWTEGNAPPYSIETKRTRFLRDENNPQPFLTAELGGERPSIYTVQRSGYIDSWSYPVDWDPVRLTYSLRLPNPEMTYILELAFYEEGQGLKATMVKVDGHFLGTVNYSPGSLKKAKFTIPPAVYEDSLITLRLEPMLGEMVTLAGLKVYQYELEDGFEEGSVSSGTDVEPEEGPTLTVGPNIFDDVLKIRYKLRKPGRIRLTVYDRTGRKVIRLLDGKVGRGTHSLEWRGLDEKDRPLQGGVYFLMLQTETGSITRKVLLLR